MIMVNNLSFGYSDTPLYEDVNFVVGKGQKVGLVGANGSGKSTLLKLLSAQEEASSGKLKIIGKLGMVPQEVKNDPLLSNAKTIKEYIKGSSEADDFKIKKILSGLECSLDISRPPDNLSGGEKTKLALARALLSDADILTLDEPTNFMDLPGKRWVMDFLSSCDKTVILISHDLELMDKAIDKVLYINPSLQTIEEYKGNYSDYLRLKKEKDELLKRQIAVQKKHIKNLEEGLTKLSRYTSTKGVRARVRQQKKIETAKAKLPEAPKELKKMKMKLPDPANVGELPVRLINISKSFSAFEVLRDFSISLRRGERIALIGPNGAGKSTLIKLITGVHGPDNGEIIKSRDLYFGYYSQELENFDLDEKVIDAFIKATKKDENWTRAFLGRFMFTGDKVFQRIGTLSGGEKTRLSIATITAHNYNMLILDEPTTYLDVFSQRVILEALKEYKGTMLVVSHTPEFIEELSPQRAILMPEGKVVYWEQGLLEKILEV